jgi:hypothetical protein
MLPADLCGEIAVPPVAAVLPKRLGSFPFWRGQEPFLEAMQAIYAQASSRGLGLFLGERDTGKTTDHHPSTRLRDDVHQSGAAFLDDDFEGAFEGWPQDACVFHRPLGVDAKPPRHRGEIHRRLI